MEAANGNTITIEVLEALAHQIEQEEDAERARLARLITAYARILAVRAPESFEPQPLERSDEDGHSDNSYPPKQEYKDYNGPALLTVRGETYEHASTSSGYYYDWRVVQTGKGLYVRRDGGLMVCNVSGTGHFGQFAAHPGTCSVQIAMEYERADEEDVTLTLLNEAEAKLRALAFPHVAALRARQA